MCGIVGGLSSNNEISYHQITRATDAISHRGPDSQGVWISEDSNVGLGHRRLSVIDCSPLGTQPMHSASGRYTIVFNGEIYNFRKLRVELVELGYTFLGESDTEVLLAAIEKFGIHKSLLMVEGMFAAAVWDHVDQILHIVRDRAGIKPLYYGVSPKGFAFASELKAFVKWNGQLPDISSQGLFEYMRLGYVPAPLSIFDGVNKLLPGHILSIDLSFNVEVNQYWSIDDEVQKGRSKPFVDSQVAISEVESSVRNAVDKQLVSDVPIGAFLSGGIDSSLVVSMMQELKSSPVKTFTIGFDSQEFNEARYAFEVAKHLGTDHHELYITDSDARSLAPKVAEIYDEPFADQSMIPTLLVSTFAREEVTVALSGDGGDELFGGYNRYLFVEKFWQRLKQIPLPLRQLIVKGIKSVPASAWPHIFSVYQKTTNSPPVVQPKLKMAKIASILASQNLEEIYSRLISQWSNPELLLLNDLVGKMTPLRRSIAVTAKISDAEAQMIWDFKSYMVDDLLTKVDRASMSVGLEVRVPLLDETVVGTAWKTPYDLKIKNGGGKWVLREILKQRLPERLVERPKMGFSVPIDDWLRSGLKDWAGDLLSSDSEALKLLQSSVVSEFWQSHLSGSTNNGGQIWTVIMFLQWYEVSRKWI